MANKLELTWYGKDEPIRVEPRLLIENAALSNTAADPDTENMLIHGDDLPALKAKDLGDVFRENEMPLTAWLLHKTEETHRVA